MPLVHPSSPSPLFKPHISHGLSLPTPRPRARGTPEALGLSAPRHCQGPRAPSPGLTSGRPHGSTGTPQSCCCRWLCSGGSCSRPPPGAHRGSLGREDSWWAGSVPPPPLLPGTSRELEPRCPTLDRPALTCHAGIHQGHTGPRAERPEYYLGEVALPLGSHGGCEEMGVEGQEALGPQSAPLDASAGSLSPSGQPEG